MRKCPVKNKFLITATLLIMISGCGYKGNPVPYPMMGKDVKSKIKNLETTVTQDSIVLKWKFHDKSGIIHYIMIERSAVDQSKSACKDCPQTFSEIGRIIVKDKSAGQEQSLSFIDSKVLKGHIYNYHLMLCEENTNCTEAAKEEINFK